MKHIILLILLLNINLSCYSNSEVLVEQFPVAPPGHEEIAERIFNQYISMSPEEWAARYSHTIGSSSFNQYRYKNEVLHNWIHRLHKILNNPTELLKYKKQFLSPSEIEKTNNNDSF